MAGPRNFRILCEIYLISTLLVYISLVVILLMPLPPLIEGVQIYRSHFIYFIVISCVSFIG